MELTNKHLTELIVFEVWTDKFTRACVAGTSPEIDEMITEGLIHMDGYRTDSIVYISVTVKGRQALLDVGIAAVIEAIFEFGKPHLLDLCDPRLTLADLPLLFVSKNELVRDFALRKYDEFTGEDHKQAP